MRKDREKALLLRIKGFSYNEIQVQLSVPKSTLSGWFRNVVLSDSARKRLNGRVRQGVLNSLVKRNHAQTHLAWKRARATQAVAKREINIISKKELLLIGTALYWAEGYKRLTVRDGKTRTFHEISLTNADPSMIIIFIQFLEQCLDIPKSQMKVCVHMFEHMNEDSVLKYWGIITRVPKENFTKPSYAVSKASKKIRPYNRLPYGTAQVRVANTPKFHRLIGWIEGMKSHI